MKPSKPYKKLTDKSGFDIIDTIIAELDALGDTARYISKDEVLSLGDYKYSGARLTLTPASASPPTFDLFELERTDDHTDVEFCYLYDRKRGTGLILPKPYKHFSAQVQIL